MPAPAVSSQPPSHSFPPVHLFPNNPYPQPSPPITHKVWILDCRACGMFITNRAMKAVLLLRPNVSLYSSDALPLNCSAYSSNPEALQPQPMNKYPSPSTPSRTCECLTQTLCCHGCGGPIGYMIVIPCSRCTSSISATNRATNGHRFVFHSSEVVGTLRHYIKGEPSVVRLELPIHSAPQYIPYSPDQELSYGSETSPSRSEYLSTPPLEFASPAFIRYRNHSPESRTPYYDRSPPPYPPQSPIARSPSGNGLNRQLASPVSYPMDHKDLPTVPPSLKPGDVIFWHHLSRSGEISGVADDRRARSPFVSRAAGQVFFNR